MTMSCSRVFLSFAMLTGNIYAKQTKEYSLISGMLINNVTYNQRSHIIMQNSFNPKYFISNYTSMKSCRWGGHSQYLDQPGRSNLQCVNHTQRVLCIHAICMYCLSLEWNVCMLCKILCTHVVILNLMGLDFDMKLMERKKHYLFVNIRMMAL